MSQDQVEKPSSSDEYEPGIRSLRAIGASALADEIDRLDIAVKVAEIEAMRNHLMVTYDLHQMKEDRLVDDVKTINADFLNNSINYNNIVAGLGYAGFIALLSITKSMVFRIDFLVAVLFLGISLVAFVVWTTVQGYLFVRAVKKLSPLFMLPEGEFDRRVIIERFNSAEQARTIEFARMQRFWPTAFLLSLITGLTAASILFASIVLVVLDAEKGIVTRIISLFELFFNLIF